jgi:hypothetical protein
MANLPQQPSQPLPVARRYTTFAAYYGDVTLDPYRGNYRRILERLDPEVNNLITHELLLEQAVGNTVVSQAYLCCALQRDQVRVYCLHVVSRYTGSMDGRETPWDGNSYAYLGDVTQGVITTIELPATAFQSVANIRAKTSDYIITNLDRLGDKGLPHIAVDDAEATFITKRQIMYLPYRYAALLLKPAGYNLREIWEILYPALVTEDDLQNCAPLLKWLRVISLGTLVPRQANRIRTTSAVLTVSVPIANEDLIQH